MSTPPRSPLALAALATVAIPGLDVVGARGLDGAGSDFELAALTDAQGRRWVVRAPTSAVAGAALEAEVALLGALATSVDEGLLPFQVPRPAGFAPLAGGGRAMVSAELPGRALQVASISGALAQQVGRAVAAIHDLDTSVVSLAGLPMYDAETYRTRRLAELDEAARTGHVPPDLLRRWEQALEDVRLWRFAPTVVHGDLAGEQLMVAGEEVVAVLDWADAQVADPADDLAWLLAAAPEETGEQIMAAYRKARTGGVDEFLAARTLLASELALPRWLMHGVRTRDDAVLEDAIEMLSDLRDAVADAEPIAPAPDPVPANTRKDDDTTQMPVTISPGGAPPPGPSPLPGTPPARQHAPAGRGDSGARVAAPLLRSGFDDTDTGEFPAPGMATFGDEPFRSHRDTG